MTLLEKLAELKSIAEKATKGPWQQGFSDGTGPEYVCSRLDSIAKTNWGCSCCENDPTPEKVKDAAYIAAANPQTVLALIEVIRVQREALKNECACGPIPEVKCDACGVLAKTEELIK